MSAGVVKGIGGTGRERTGRKGLVDCLRVERCCT